jgi:hypothetical protein
MVASITFDRPCKDLDEFINPLKIGPEHSDQLKQSRLKVKALREALNSHAQKAQGITHITLLGSDNANLNIEIS